MKELLQQTFATPKGHPKSKPFFDHVIKFSWADNRIWLRNYQVIVALDKKQVKQEGVTLVEVGPRLTLQPIKVRTPRRSPSEPNSVLRAAITCESIFGSRT